MKNTVVSNLVLGLICLSLFLPNAHPLDLPEGQWIDLTHPFSDETIYWHTADKFEKTTVFEGQTDRGYFYSAYNFRGAEHGGTHMDAPVHFYEGRHTAEQVPLEQLIGNAVVIDVSGKARQNRDYQVSVEDILTWEKQNGKLPEGTILLINTGSNTFWPNKEKYMGTDKRGEEAVKHLSFPGIHPQTAKFLVTNRKIKAVGLDTPSIDYGKSKDFETHRIFFEQNIPGFENVANIDKLPITGSVIFALPMKIKGGSGAPLRIIAFVPGK
jgi:kynurenine formamidase